MRPSKTVQYITAISLAAWLRIGIKRFTTMAITRHVRKLESKMIDCQSRDLTDTINQVLLQGTFSSDQSVSAMGNIRWTPQWVTRTQTQIDPRSPQSMLQIENEYTGNDFSASVKVLNPSLMEGGLTAIVLADYMQSITPKISLGMGGVWQRASLGSKPETALSYVARYRDASWIASAQVQAAGVLNASYWRRLSDRVDAGVDCQLQFQPGAGGAGMFSGMRKEGQTTVGVKYSFMTSIYRAQIDSTGKVGCVLEKKVAPAITISLAAEIDQWKVCNTLTQLITFWF